ncbi:Cysteinyl-tRNA synthetase/mycothiol ligase [Parasponia andersonii]|uniref:cysteine--tRNA ligase n=1 Tax=Parasponia andersonii TaxID=3476 RepID=A0A2P5DDF2_PARAD|nr:Cysteinyl-tRNA synthetase/mycothiol ligase [Parasponia andersonii]
MGALLKCHKPLFSMQFSSIFNSTRTIQLRTHRPHPFFFKPATSIRCLSSSSSSPLSIESDGVTTETPLSSELWLHNTMSRKKEAFRPKVEGKVGMYVCGVTAYDLSHIGHARVYVTFDVLYRYLRHLGYQVCYVRNFTDVDDKIIARANELGEDPIDLSRRYCQEFNQDMVYLHCLQPSVEPRVSDHIPQIMDMIKQIIDNGYAYPVDGDVYFNVDKFPEYGHLSGRKLEDNRAGERVAIDSRKKHPADFALWKSAKGGEPFWDSPWGPGRPGWHIECSAMSAAYLGYSFDIHGGGMDLVIDLYHPLALRLFLLGTHYRSPINYSDIQLESASDRIFYIYQTLHDCEDVLSLHDATTLKDSIPPSTTEEINKFRNVFVASMSDDLHTPVVFAALSDPLKTINDLLHTRKGKKQAFRVESLAALQKIIRNVLDILGLMPTSYSKELREKALKRAKLTEEQVLHKIEERTEARRQKEYEKSDAIRKELAAVGIALMDSPDGTTWRPAVPLALQEQYVAAT